MTLEEIGLAEERGDEGRLRVFVQFGRGSHLFELSVVHDGYPVGHRERLLLVVGHVEERDAEFLLYLFEFDLHVLAELPVEARQRFVEEEHVRLAHDGARHRDALFLSARQLGRLSVVVPR